MANNFVGINISGEKFIIERLRLLPEQAQDMGVEAANEKIVNIERKYTPYKYVSVKQSGGWKSEKQRRYVMAAIRDGRIKIPYRRTQTMARGWKTYGSGKNQIVANEVPYAPYVKDIAGQTRGHMLRGWDVVQDDIKNHQPQIVKAFESGVNKAIRKLGL
jgi:hypothetical protein